MAKIVNMKLPGEAIQLKMAPIERILEMKAQAREAKKARQAGVLALFYPASNNEIHLVLILRKTYKGVHSAQIAFPGGKKEVEDASLLETALRETEEEVGVTRTSVSVVKKLTEVYIPPSNFFVQAYIGITPTTPHFIPQESEVEEVIEVPLVHFMDDTILVTKTLSTSYATNIEVPAFLLNGHVVWGATAMILSEVRELLKAVL